MNPSPFKTHGIEIEYMIVDEATLQIRPISDEVIRELTAPGISPTKSSLLPSAGRTNSPCT
jgi:gamma-glutamyl:cysteine ligase YbdK (ATP-grasp superfamily)